MNYSNFSDDEDWNDIVEQWMREAASTRDVIAKDILLEASTLRAAFPTDEARAAISLCLKMMVSEPDTAFSTDDRGIGQHLARLGRLTDAQALVGRRIVWDHRLWLDDRFLLSKVMDRPIVNDDFTHDVRPCLSEEDIVTVTPVTLNGMTESSGVNPVTLNGDVYGIEKTLEQLAALERDIETICVTGVTIKPRDKKRGRPVGTSSPLTTAERSKRYRESKRLVDIWVSGAVAERIRLAREGHDMTMDQLLAAALDALERMKMAVL